MYFDQVVEHVTLRLLLELQSLKPSRPCQSRYSLFVVTWMESNQSLWSVLMFINRRPVVVHCCGNPYRQTSNISHILVGSDIVDHPDVVGASPVGAAPTSSSFLTYHLASIYCVKTTARLDEKHLSLAFGTTYITGLMLLHAHPLI